MPIVTPSRTLGLMVVNKADMCNEVTLKIVHDNSTENHFLFPGDLLKFH